MKVILESLGSRLRKLRERKNVSQELLAKKCGLHRTAVGLLERGERIPRFDTLMILGRQLRVPVSEMVRGCERWGTWPVKKIFLGSREKRSHLQ
jgi:transcriptional regulator with XRE-family HTH domain